MTTLLRQCGECRACCTPLAISELKKPAGVPCKHIGGPRQRGCRIYASRPDSCRGYLCGWRTGLGGDNERPDRVGVLLSSIDIHPDAIAHIPHMPTAAVLAHETRAGAFDEPDGARLIAIVVRSGYLVFAIHGKQMERCRLIGPAPLVHAAQAWCEGNPLTRLLNVPVPVPT